MKLKKWLALVLVLAMLSALVACGGEAEKNPTTEPTTEAPTTVEPTDETPVSEAKKVVRGENNGNTYTNSALDYTVTLGSEWTVADEAGLAELAGVTAGAINNETAQEMIENGQTVFDFYASKDDGLSTINVTLTKNSEDYLASLDEETLLSMTMSQNQSILEASGFENLNMEIVPITFAGEDHKCIALTATYSGLPIYEYMLMFATEPCIYTVTACSFNEDVAADYLAFFTKIGETPVVTPTEEAPTELHITSDIVGTWCYDMPCAELMEQALLITGFECDVADDIVLKMTLTFNEDGTCIAKADEESAKAILEEMLRAMSTVMDDLLYAEFEKQQGWDKATTDAQLAAQGLTMESLVEQSLAQADTSSLDISTSFESESYYLVEGDVYYNASTVEDLLAGKYTESMQFVINGDQMQFLACELYNEDAVSLEEFVSFPITLTRQ